ncbi:putative sulfate exporter family transporter [Niabella sp. CC-SYL272]|uniref:YeiH family protein n=1 Tax=Niabella agricola TaxID=2891571 RepID=UPI001F241D95|nr:putative sulfate exporter family transporter [Niabella agricola]MCF3107228.1 putative sulfate exporter family transporter [Niabella agricola]
MKKAWMHEDWAIVLLGGLIILLALSGLIIPVPVYSWKNGTDLTSTVLSSSNLLNIGKQLLIVAPVAALAAVLTRKPLKTTVPVFVVIFMITQAALVLAGNSVMKDLNLEAVIFSLALGLIIGNCFKLPDWFREVLNAELYVKIGLVLLGCSVIFSDVMKAGGLGLVQALVVVLSVWYFAFWLCRKMKVDDDLTMMISSAVSICGVSAAIATSGAIKGDSKKLSYVISMVLVTAVPMMIFMPVIANYLQLPERVTGAWLGGSIDTSGAVVASGSLVGEEALKISTIVKFSQNVLLGIAAFAISVYWTYSKSTAAGSQEKPTLKVIWQRFPKFILGFIGASLLFSFLITPEVNASVKNGLKSLQGLWFGLAFTSIGLETRFADLFKNNSRKPLWAFLIAQLFNVIITLIIAFILFR